MTKKILIIGPLASENTRDLIEAAEQKKCFAKAAPLSRFSFENAAGRWHIFLDGESIDIFDIVIFRAFNKNPSLARLIARTMLRDGKTLIDEVLATRDVSEKLEQAALFSANTLPHPATFHSLDTAAFERYIKQVIFPIIAKPIHGQKGCGILLLKNARQALNLFHEEARTYLFQEYLPIAHDMRVFVVGNTVLGGMKRFVVPGDYRSNVSLGARAESFSPSKEISALALEATQVLGYEVAGVDIIEHAGKLFVLEVNHTPQWQGFKSVTSINPAKYIIDYAIAKNSL